MVITQRVWGNNEQQNSYWRRVGALVVFLAVATPAVASDTISYQGYLTDPGGGPVPGPINVEMRIFSVTGGGLLCAESHGAVPVNNGLFTVLIADGVPLTGTFGPALFAPPTAPLELEIVVNGETLTPRRPLSGVAHAQNAANSQALSGLASDAFLHLDTAETQTVSEGVLVVRPDQGAIETQNAYLYSSPQTYTTAISADRFQASSLDLNNWNMTSAGFYRYAQEAGSLFAFAGFNVPAGASLQRLRCYFYDANLFALIDRLFARVRYRAPGTPDTISAFGTLDIDSRFPNSSTDVRSDSVALSPTSVPEAAALQIELFWDVTTGGTTLRFYGCDVEYTLQKVSSP